MEKRKKKPWVRFRHRVCTALVRIPVTMLSLIKCGFVPRRFKEQGKRQYLVLLNHQTPYDQFFVALSFHKQVYYVASEDIFSGGFLSSALRYTFAPIPIKKSVTDVRAVVDCIKVAKEGGTIAMAPEGNRTYSGFTGNIKPTVATLAKKLALPIAIYRVEGGYGVIPRFSDAPRRGKMTAGVTKVIEPEEYLSLSDTELYDLICKELYVDEACDTGRFRSNKRALYLERCTHFCPKCGLSTFRTAGNFITCDGCGLKVEYGERKELTSADPAFSYRYFGDWYRAQEAFISSLDLTAPREDPYFRDTARFSRVIPYKKKEKIDKHASVALFCDRVEVKTASETEVFSFAEVSAATVCGHNKLNLYRRDGIFQFKGDKRFNALKYVNFYYHFSHLTTPQTEENNHAEFLGL